LIRPTPILCGANKNAGQSISFLYLNNFPKIICKGKRILYFTGYRES
jgi:hypothetical protein